MWLQWLHVRAVRNLRDVRLDLPEGLVLVVGRNAQGKTSLLEAIYLLSTGRSFRTRRVEDAIARDGGPLEIEGGVRTRLGETRLEVRLEPEGRRLVADGAEHEPGDYLGRLDVVAVTLDRMSVLRGPPVERRRFLDRGVAGLDPAFVRRLGEYRRCLGQRNALLRARGSDAELDAWDGRVAEAATRVHLGRRDYAARLAASLDGVASVTVPEGEALELGYRPSPPDVAGVAADRMESAFVEALARGRSRDRERGFTGVGPHRDELSIGLQGMDLRRFGSAGQVRSAMIALKLGKLVLQRGGKEDSPLFLLDDLDADLDEARLAALGDFLHRGGFQTVAATSKEAVAERLGTARLKVSVERGRVHSRPR